jgi:hypothetical protein
VSLGACKESNLKYIHIKEDLVIVFQGILEPQGILAASAAATSLSGNIRVPLHLDSIFALAM